MPRIINYIPCHVAPKTQQDRIREFIINADMHRDDRSLTLSSVAATEDTFLRVKDVAEILGTRVDRRAICVIDTGTEIVPMNQIEFYGDVGLLVFDSYSETAD